LPIAAAGIISFVRLYSVARKFRAKGFCMPDNATAIATYVDATAVALNMPLDAQHREGVTAAMTRLAAFAADVATVELANDAEIAGVLVP
jgi:hypothetical protein